jgi:hypothetical protein
MSGCGGTRKTRQNVSDSVYRTISHAVHCFIAKHHAHRKASWRATQYLINAARGKATWCYANTVHLLVKNHFSIGFPSAIITVCQRVRPVIPLLQPHPHHRTQPDRRLRGTHLCNAASVLEILFIEFKHLRFFNQLSRHLRQRVQYCRCINRLHR